MELKKQILKQNIQKSKAFTQVTLDDDCIVKDSKPDIIKIIHTKGSIIFEESKVNNQTVWVTGKLKFTVLYRSDGNAGKVETLSDTIDFGEKIMMDEIEELDTVKLSGKLEDLSITAINSRKLAVRAVVGITAVSEQLREEELVSGAEGEEDIQQKQENRQMLLLVTSKKDILRTHNEMNLPAASPNIGRILYYNADIQNKEVSLSNDRVQVQGMAHLDVLYSSLEGQLEWYDAMVPFSGTMDCEGADAQSLYWIVITPADIELEAAADYDGEMRSLHLDMVFDVSLKVWEEKEETILSDIYALNKHLVPEKEIMKLTKLVIKNEAKLRLSQQMKLDEGQEKILQLCSYEGAADIDSVETIDNGLKVEGVLGVHILYATVDDSSPLAHAFEQIPFTQVIDVPGLRKDNRNIRYELEPGMDQLQVNLLDNERYEIKASLSITALVLEEDYTDKIVDVRESELDMERLQRQPGITGYIVQSQESLWDIARRYHTTEEGIIATNGLKTANVKAGDKIIIVKSVG